MQPIPSRIVFSNSSFTASAARATAYRATGHSLISVVDLNLLQSQNLRALSAWTRAMSTESYQSRWPELRPLSGNQLLYWVTAREGMRMPDVTFISSAGDASPFIMHISDDLQAQLLVSHAAVLTSS